MFGVMTSPTGFEGKCSDKHFIWRCEPAEGTGHTFMYYLPMFRLSELRRFHLLLNGPDPEPVLRERTRPSTNTP